LLLEYLIIKENSMLNNFLTPVARLVGGDVFEGNTTDAKGNALTIKSGPNAGQPRTEFSIGIAIPKAGETHWNQTEWGQILHQVAQQGFPTLFQQGQCIRPDFAFKVTDGDSQIPNKKNVKPCDREGYPGNWVLWFSNGFAPKCYTTGGEAVIPDKSHPNAVKRGYYCRVYGDVRPNNDMENAGIYLNHSMVEFIAFGEEIVGGPNGADVFGNATVGTLPQGASASPTASATPIAQPTPQAQPAAPVGGVQPAPGFLNPAQPADPVATPPAQPAAPIAAQWSNGTQTFPEADLLAQGWTVETLQANGWARA